MTLLGFVKLLIAWRISPFNIESNYPLSTVCDTEKMYDNMMNKYSYGNLKHPDLYIDETTMRMCYTHRRWFANLITNLVKEGKMDKALKALDKCETEIPAYNVPHSSGSSSVDIAEAYIACGKPEKAEPILDYIAKTEREYLTYYLTLSNSYFAGAQRYCRDSLYGFASVQATYGKLADSDFPNKKKYAAKAQQLEKELQSLYSAVMSKCDNAGIEM